MAHLKKPAVLEEKEEEEESEMEREKLQLDEVGGEAQM